MEMEIEKEKEKKGGRTGRNCRGASSDRSKPIEPCPEANQSSVLITARQYLYGVYTKSVMMPSFGGRWKGWNYRHNIFVFGLIYHLIPNCDIWDVYPS